MVDYTKLRCARTGNLCGTDTWPRDTECHCEPCQRWLGRRDGFAACLALLRDPPEHVLKATRECEPFAHVDPGRTWRPGQIVAATVMRAAADAIDSGEEA